MNSINVVFETEEFKELSNKKGSLSWREFILQLLAKENQKAGKKQNSEKN